MKRKRKPSLLKGRAGFSLVEILLFSSVSAVILLYLVYWVDKPNRALGFIQRSNMEAEGNRAADLIMNELREADPSSINWSLIPPLGNTLNEISFQKTTYDMANPSTYTLSSVQFRIETNASTGLVSLFRSINGGPTSVLLANVVAPTSSIPLFEAEPYKVIRISLLYQPKGAQPVSCVRRVAMKG